MFIGSKVAGEVGVIRGAQTLTELSIIPVRRGYLGYKIGQPHAALQGTYTVFFVEGFFLLKLLVL